MAWYMTDSGLYNDEFISLPAKPIEKPFPYALWRIEAYRNNGLPFNELIPDISGKMDVWSLKRENVIRVYDISEPQTGFKSNGLAILTPESCTSHHDDDKWDIDLIHPIDDFGKWKCLLVNNVLKVDGQLFRIDSNEPSISSNGEKMTVHANHISCDMADRLITLGTFSGGSPQDFINWAESEVVPSWMGHEWYGHYTFSGSSDIDQTLVGGEYVNCSLLAAFVGADNCLMNLTGGELYRNNFYFSINQRMEGAKDNAFNLRYSLDMTSIKQTVDYSDFCTDLWCYDNWGNEWAVAYTPEISDRIHHPISRMLQFNYSEFEGSMERLMQDGNAEWQRRSTPRVTYEVEIASLKNDPRYSDFLQLQNYQYGDKGTIYCPELDISTEQKIISIDKDEITGEILRLKLGNLRDSVIRPTYMGSTITSGTSPEDKQLRALQNQNMGTSIVALEQFPISALETRTIKVLEGN